MEQLTEKVKELRKKNGWTQEDMARRIGVSLSTVQRWEKQGGKWRTKILSETTSPKQEGLLKPFRLRI